MGEADIGDAGGKKARAAAACFDPCLRLLRAEAAQSLVGQRVEQGFLVGEIAIEGSRADPDIARECPEANRDAVPFGKLLEARRDHGGPEVAMMVDRKSTRLNSSH